MRCCRLNNTRLLIIAIFIWSSPGLAEDQEIRIGVRAIRGAEYAFQQWQPTADYLTEQLPGFRFTIIPHEINSTLNQAVSRDEFDFVLTNPAAYVEMEKRYGAHRLLTLINKRQGKGYTQFGSVIFTRSDRSDLHSLQDLKNKTFMGADEQGFGGWRIAWRELLNNGIDPYRDLAALKFGGGIQRNVVFAVLHGDVDAGAVRTDMLEHMAQAGEIQLSDFKVLGLKHNKDFTFIHSTPLYPEWPFAQLAKTDDKLAQQVASVLLQLTQDHPAAIAGNYVGWHTPLDYQPVDELLRELRVGPYAHKEMFNLELLISTYWHIILLSLVLFLFFAFMVLRLKILNRQLRVAEQHLLQSNQQLKDMTVVDGLTGIGNRRKLDEFLTHNWGRVCRDSTPVCVMLLDIDYFKDYNDTYGHIAGDECLKKIADAISSQFRRTGELVVRYGGEEFLIMIINCDLPESKSQAEALRQDIENLMIEHTSSKISSVVTVSIGIGAETPTKDSLPEALILMADQALYKAKHAGRNRIHVINY